jgi:iron complex outermembrane receptor protein
MKNRIRLRSLFDGASFYMKVVLVAVASIFALSASPSAMGEEKASATSSSMLDEVIVTARKRDETSLSVPVTITAVGAKELERRAIAGLDALAKTVPGLTLQEQGGTIQGGTVSMRGITGPNSNALGDQAVSFNMDGVAIARSTVRRLGAFDQEQIEVLKGPQALFFGKNSPGGVISMRSADPTKTFESKVSIGYETQAREARADAYISGPLSESVGVRLALHADFMDGYFHNAFPAGLPLSLNDDGRGPKNNEIDVRGTLKFDNGGPLTTRVKITTANSHGSGIAYGFQTISCPSGVFLKAPALAPGAVDDCKANDTVLRSGLGPSFLAYDPRMTSNTYAIQKQQLVSVEMNYQLPNKLTLTSVSGYYHYDVVANDHYDISSAIWLVPSAQSYEDQEFSEELRLSSNYDSAVNFMVGALFGSTKTQLDVHSLFGASPPSTNAFGLPSPTAFNQYQMEQKGASFSAFAQVSWKIAPTVELSAGGRYSSEDKKLDKALASFFGSDPRYGVGLTSFTVPKLKATDFSPEVTAAWHPRETTNLYLSYKRGFLSGGYNGSSDVLLPGQKATYDQQTVKGFEAGVKSRLLDGRMRLNVAAYDYKVAGLQVASYQQGISTIRNAGEVGVKGVEADVTWSTPAAGLQVRGGLAYNRARYNVYTAPCWVGQTAALGCTINSVPGLAAPDTQNLAGAQVPNAPEITANAGFEYEHGAGSGHKVGLSADVNYSDTYVTSSKNPPYSDPPAQAMIDASLRYGAEDDRWEVAFVGRNLSNRFYWTDSQEYFGSGPVPDRFATVSRGREFWLRVSAKFR